MPDKHILTKNGTAFLILYPQEFEINIDGLKELIASADKDAIYISNDPWLFYQPVAEEDIYSWEIPGIKLIFKEAIGHDAAKAFAERVIAKLKENSGVGITLVAIDKTKLISKM